LIDSAGIGAGARIGDLRAPRAWWMRYTGPGMKMRLCIDGGPADVDGLAAAALVNYGHFTAMQVREGRVRGLHRHLARVEAAHRELFGHGLDLEQVRARWAEAATDSPDTYLRATFYEDAEGSARLLVVLRDPVDPPPAPQRLRAVEYVRPFAHLKHVGTFAQIRHGQQAEKAGYDDALLITAEGRIAETTIANVGFLRDDRVIWPSAPMLDGIGQQLIQGAVENSDLRQEHVTVTLGDLDTFDAAFMINSVGVAPIGQIDQHRFGSSHEHLREIVELHDALPWDRLAL
jgi:branched-subunit amino acid aminotransferase/4-amino-4-deoxychorismate lyase